MMQLWYRLKKKIILLEGSIWAKRPHVLWIILFWLQSFYKDRHLRRSSVTLDELSYSDVLKQLFWNHFPIFWSSWSFWSFWFSIGSTNLKGYLSPYTDEFLQEPNFIANHIGPKLIRVECKRYSTPFNPYPLYPLPNASFLVLRQTSIWKESFSNY